MANLLTLVEMSEKLNCSAKTFKRLVSKYNIPHYQLDSRLRFDPVEVLACLAKKPEERPKTLTVRTSTKKLRSGLLSERLGI